MAPRDRGRRRASGPARSRWTTEKHGGVDALDGVVEAKTFPKLKRLKLAQGANIEAPPMIFQHAISSVNDGQGRAQNLEDPVNKSSKGPLC